MGKELIPQTDGFGVPENFGGQFIHGQMLKFIDGNYVVDKTEPLADEPLVAIGVSRPGCDGARTTTTTSGH